jgi:hypothetical protein
MLIIDILQLSKIQSIKYGMAGYWAALRPLWALREWMASRCKLFALSPYCSRFICLKFGSIERMSREAFLSLYEERVREIPTEAPSAQISSKRPQQEFEICCMVLTINHTRRPNASLLRQSIFDAAITSFNCAIRYPVTTCRLPESSRSSLESPVSTSRLSISSSL